MRSKKGGSTPDDPVATVPVEGDPQPETPVVPLVAPPVVELFQHDVVDAIDRSFAAIAAETDSLGDDDMLLPTPPLVPEVMSENDLLLDDDDDDDDAEERRKKYLRVAVRLPSRRLPLPLGAPELVYRVLSYLDAVGLQIFRATAVAAREAGTFDVDKDASQFSLHWRGTLQTGDRLEVWDLKDRKRLWREAVVTSATEHSVRVHYQSWGSKWDTTLRRSSKRLAPLFTRSKDWRFHLRRKQLVEVTKWGNTSGWWLGVVLNVTRPRPGARWTSADVAVLGFTRVRGDDNQQKAVCLQRSLADIPSNRICHIDGFNSEQLSWFGDHLGMSLANFRFNTTFLAELNS